ncbi:MAG: thioredoxin domain-containing protein [Planctomycetes bacterium]|nr:thioredoxin domain-containing protein [Planctomycetota bacterium]MBI3843479.1 thioredoxin domain-containing protein [Planctomycetota bacterium]
MTKSVPAPPQSASLRFGFGLVALVVAGGSALVLALGHLGAMAVPGCGPESACAKLAASTWGKVPLVDWPVSFLGVAWFAGLAAAWSAARGTPGPSLAWLSRLGAFGSTTFVGAMIGEQLLCPWCLAVHVASVVFWAIVEWGRLARPAAAPSKWQVATGVAAFALMTGLLAFAEHSTRGAVRARAERDLAASMSEMGKFTGTFTGRYRLGPDPAAIRIVVFTDYQCPDCKRIEGELRTAMKTHDSVSLSVKHFPMCAECNPNAPTMHANACWAARAAEAAGQVGGSAGFWKMHEWLFARGGSFTNEELDRGLAELGLDRTRVVAAIHGPQTLANVQADIAEAMKLGISTTPMIFVNGVELRGWNAPDAVLRTIATLEAKRPAATTAESDRPALALEKSLGDWREAPTVAMPPDAFPRTLGPDSAPVSIVVFGDYQEPYTAEVDRTCRTMVKVRSDVRYAFRHYPVDQQCNGTAEKTLHPLACLAARAAEASAALGGIEAFWKMHDWLMTHQGDFNKATVSAEATAIGIEGDVLWEAMQLPELLNSIGDDVAAAKKLGLTAIPMIFVAGKEVQRWKLGEENLLPRIVEEAAKK